KVATVLAKLLLQIIHIITQLRRRAGIDSAIEFRLPYRRLGQRTDPLPLVLIFRAAQSNGPIQASLVLQQANIAGALGDVNVLETVFVERQLLEIDQLSAGRRLGGQFA